MPRFNNYGIQCRLIYVLCVIVLQVNALLKQSVHLVSIDDTAPCGAVASDIHTDARAVLRIRVHKQDKMEQINIHVTRVNYASIQRWWYSMLTHKCVLCNRVARKCTAKAIRALVSIDDTAPCGAMASDIHTDARAVLQISRDQKDLKDSMHMFLYF